MPRNIRNRLRRTKLLSPFVPRTPSFGELTVTPSQFGGDPTGMKDSTTAVLKALETCINVSKVVPRKFPNGANDGLGCTVDLEGGEYLISRTLTIPTYTSNVRIQTGSLVANRESTYWQGEQRSSSGRGGASQDECTFPTSRTDQWCQELRPAPASGDESANACEALCCQTAGCNTWQFCPEGKPCAASLPSNTSLCWFAPEGSPGGVPYDADALCSKSEPSEPKSVGWIGGSSKYPPVPYPFFLIQVGGTSQCVSPHQGSCNEDIGFPGLFLDGNNVANGLQINQVMGTTVGPQTYILNFTSYGIQVSGGHEVMIDQTWLGETNFDHNYSAPGAGSPRATAIDLRSNDHYILDSIVFSSLVGLNNQGAANFVNGLHVWFPLNEALQFGATAFRNTGAHNRYQNCYIDASVAVFSNPSQVTWLDGITLGGHGILLEGDVVDLTITGTLIDGGQITHTGPDNATISGVVIASNPGSKVSSKATLTYKTGSRDPESTFGFDFCASVPFPRIQRVISAVFTSASGNDFPVVVAREPSGCKVQVDIKPAAVGSLTVTVDTSA